MYIYIQIHISFTLWLLMINSTGCPRSPGGTTGAMVRGCTGRMTPGLGMARYIIIDPYRGLQKWEIYSGLVDILWYFDAFWCILIAKNDDSPMDLSFFSPTCADTAFWPMLAHTPDLWPQRIPKSRYVVFLLPLMFNWYFFRSNSKWLIYLFRTKSHKSLVRSVAVAIGVHG